MRLSTGVLAFAMAYASAASAQVDTSFYNHGPVPGGLNPALMQALIAQRQAQLQAEEQRRQDIARAEEERERDNASAAQTAQQSASDRVANLIALGKCDEALRLSTFYGREDLTAATTRACSKP